MPPMSRYDSTFYRNVPGYVRLAKAEDFPRRNYIRSHSRLNLCSTSRTKIVEAYQNIKMYEIIIWGAPSDLLVSERQNAIPCQIEATQRRLMRRALPRSSAEIQACITMSPWQASSPRGRKCEKKPSAAGEQRAKKNKDHTFHLQGLRMDAGIRRHPCFGYGRAALQFVRFKTWDNKKSHHTQS